MDKKHIKKIDFLLKHICNIDRETLNRNVYLYLKTVLLKKRSIKSKLCTYGTLMMPLEITIRGVRYENNKCVITYYCTKSKHKYTDMHVTYIDYLPVPDILTILTDAR